MKKFLKIYFALILVLVGHALFGQQIGNLDGISYQAVAIDENGKQIVGIDINGKPMYKKEIGVKFSILKGNTGPTLYEETHTTLTDQYGLFSLVIGKGIISSSSTYTQLMDIPWIDADQFLKVEISTKNDGNYKLVNLQKFMTVPYAFYTDDIADNAITSAKIVNGSVINEDIADGTIDITAKVTGVLPVVNGGTGVESTTEGSLLIGGGTGPVKSLGQAADGQIPVGVTGGDPILTNLTAGTGINIVNTPGGIEISSGVKGVSGVDTEDVTPGQILAGTTWISGPIELQGVMPGNMVVASFSASLQGCMMTTYVRNENIITVAIFNGTGTNKTIATGKFKVLVVQ